MANGDTPRPAVKPPKMFERDGDPSLYSREQYQRTRRAAQRMEDTELARTKGPLPKRARKRAAARRPSR